jgi:hypothetical protein
MRFFMLSVTCTFVHHLKQSNMTTDSKINSLQPGQAVVISKNEVAECSAERSTDGKTIRFVRTFPNGSWVVFHTSKTKTK